MLLLLALAFAPCARGQAVPGGADLPAAGACQSVRPGDTVDFSLRIDAGEGARAVVAELQMDGKSHRFRLREADLPLWRAGEFAAGGVGKRDAKDLTLYHFNYVVPQAEPGIYRTAGFAVHAVYANHEGAPVTIDRRAREQVRDYCLAVFGGSHAPAVTAFLPGPAGPVVQAQTKPFLPSPEVEVAPYEALVSCEIKSGAGPRHISLHPVRLKPCP